LLERSDDFAASTKQAVNDIIAAVSSTHPEFSVKVNDIVERKDDGDELLIGGAPHEQENRTS
jgi:hypothetical protein